MTGIADGQREGWSSDTIVLRLVIGAVAGVAFVLWELTRRAPCSTCASSPTSNSPPPP